MINHNDINLVEEYGFTRNSADIWDEHEYYKLNANNMEIFVDCFGYVTLTSYQHSVTGNEGISIPCYDRQGLEKIISFLK